MSHRTQITLTDEQYERLQSESERTGLSMAELVRRAIDAKHDAERERALATLRASTGAWKDRTFTGKEYVEEIRRGFAHRMERYE